MARETIYIVQAFQAGARGALAAEPPIRARDANHAKMRAEKLAETRLGVIAYAIEGDPVTEDYDPPRVLFTAGKTPEMD
jgi:hypothetical protein